MRVRVVSDLHLEFLTKIEIDHLIVKLSSGDPDVLVLAGDIVEVRRAYWPSFISSLIKLNKHIIWIPGNHEYYGAHFDKMSSKVRSTLNEIDPDGVVKFLNNQFIVIDNVKFICSTLWTDFDRGNPLTMNLCQFGMNDSRQIRMAGYRKMTSMDQLALHQKAVRWLFEEVRRGTENGNTNFVVTHHGPSFKSVADEYKVYPHNQYNGAFVSELDPLILDHDIHTWVHGHTHHSFDYNIGDTHIIVNPNGYANENHAGFNPTLTLNVP